MHDVRCFRHLCQQLVNEFEIESLMAMWSVNGTVNISLMILAPRWIGISSGGFSQLVLKICSVACLQDLIYG
jgi:hypothetical protein